MAKVCPECGREFGGSSTRCPICKIDLVSDGIDNSEAARKERLERLRQAQQQAVQRPQTRTVAQQTQRTVPQSRNTVRQERGAGMKVIGILLIVVGVIGILLGMIMFGDIGIACIIGAMSALLSGIGFMIADRNI